MTTSNNKRWLLLIGASLLITISGGCKKYLDQTPENSLTRDEFFKTKADAEASIIGCYDALQGCVTQFLNWGEFRADMVVTTATNDVTYPFFQYLDKTRPVSNWAVAYNLIGRANMVTEFVPNIPNLDSKFSTEERDQIVAEALFLRSLAYFYLVRTFGDVPLVLTASSNDAVNYFPAKTSADSVLKKIEADLLIAEKTIPVSYDKNADTRGRATKGAVNALQADVYLWHSKYQQAADAAQKVIDAKALYTLVPGANWFSIFSQKNSSESIFEVQFDYNINETNGLIGTAGNFAMNNVLINYFTLDQDIIRGLNNTYVSGGGAWKYSGLTTTTNISRTTNDPNFIIYRLPEVMLIKAEALVHLGGVSQKKEAIDWVDTLRARASIPLYDYLDGTAPSTLLMELIIREKGMELAMEGKRWYDLVRVATNDQNPDFLISRVLASRLVGDRALTKSRIVDPRSWYMP
ncbi:MAG: RagB/SusD family nutrient uptake outer membrane protein, partial [Bacteroidetes bacterium]|nr:RagB/SusD family nutrient uptake outer membrane protein [Bacteroidota bacterium]